MFKKMRQKKEIKEFKNFIAENPQYFGGNVKLMTGNITFDMEDELVRLRKVTKNYKLNYKMGKKKKVEG